MYLSLQAPKARLEKLTHWQVDSGSASSSPPDPATAYLLVLSLFVWSPSQWNASCRSLLLHSLRSSFSQKQPGDAASSSGSSGGSSSAARDVSAWREQSDDEVWKYALPTVRYFGLVHRLQSQLKGTVDADWNAQAKSR